MSSDTSRSYLKILGETGIPLAGFGHGDGVPDGFKLKEIVGAGAYSDTMNVAIRNRLSRDRAQTKMLAI